MELPAAPYGFPPPVRAGMRLAGVLSDLACATLRAGRRGRGRQGVAEAASDGPWWTCEARGDPAAVGAGCGSLLGSSARRLLPLMRLSPQMVVARLDGRARRLASTILPRHRAEAEAWASAAHLDVQAMLEANAIADACCTALAAPRAPGCELALARNLEFMPAGPLARASLLSVIAVDGALPVASLGWPGYLGVLSGMNSAGLAAVVLLNLARRESRCGLPIAFAVRQLLEEHATVAEAAAACAGLTIASTHYVVLADARAASVAWQDGLGSHRHDLSAGVLVCSNGARSGAGAAIDDRGGHLERLARDAPGHSPAWLRSAIASTYLEGTCAQTMLFLPGSRRLQLALGDATHPAARASWREIELGPALDGGRLAAAPHRELGRSLVPRHYTREDADARSRAASARPVRARAALSRARSTRWRHRSRPAPRAR